MRETCSSEENTINLTCMLFLTKSRALMLMMVRFEVYIYSYVYVFMYVYAYVQTHTCACLNRGSPELREACFISHPLRIYMHT
jgi:hypothetical protein